MVKIAARNPRRYNPIVAKKNLHGRTNHVHNEIIRGAGKTAIADRTLPMRKGETIVTQPNLRLVEGTSVDKTKALDAALSQIERAFGKGSIMRLGKQKALEVE